MLKSGYTMKRTPFISIIIPVYNAEKTLQKCFNSINNLNYSKQLFEVIIVDNNSTDKSKKIIQESPFRCLLQEKPGPAAARNRGAEAANGRILAFTDADACVARDWLSKIICAYEQDSHIDGIAGYSGGINNNIWAEFYQRFQEAFYFKHLAEQKPPVKHIDTKNFSIKKDCFIDVGGFNEEYLRGEDTDLGYRLFSRGYRIKYVPEVRVDHINPTDLTHQVRVFERHVKYSFRSFLSFDIKTQKVLCPHYLKSYHRIYYSDAFVVNKLLKPFLNVSTNMIILALLGILHAGYNLKLKHCLYPIYFLCVRTSRFKGKLNAEIKR